MAQRAEGLGRDAHAAVANRARRCGKIPGQLADLLRRHRAQWTHGFGTETCHGFAYLIQTVHRQMTVAGQAFGEQGIEQTEQKRRIATGTHEQMLVGDRRRFAATRVDHHHFAAPGLDRLQAFFHIRHGHDAAVGGQRVAAEDQHEVGVIDVRYWQQQTVAVHQVTGQVMG
ncbi:hypothetical protein D3C76_1082490 [compost metagenome]